MGMWLLQGAGALALSPGVRHAWRHGAEGLLDAIDDLPSVLHDTAPHGLERRGACPSSSPASTCRDWNVDKNTYYLEHDVDTHPGTYGNGLPTYGGTYGVPRAEMKSVDGKLDTKDNIRKALRVCCPGQGKDDAPTTVKEPQFEAWRPVGSPPDTPGGDVMCGKKACRGSCRCVAISQPSPSLALQLCSAGTHPAFFAAAQQSWEPRHGRVRRRNNERSMVTARARAQ